MKKISSIYLNQTSGFKVFALECQVVTGKNQIDSFPFVVREMVLAH